MKINVDEIPDSGLSLDIVEESAAIEALAGGKLGYSFLAPVSAHLEISKTADRSFFVSGEIKTSLKANCSRCLKEFDYAFEAPFTAYYERGREEEREKELKPADMDVNYLDGPELDTTELLLGQIALELPMQALCKEDCMGLCPRCGADLNLGKCGCSEKDKTDPRLAKLKDFKVK